MLYFLMIIVLCYLILAVRTAGGVPESVSATYYLLGRKGWMTQALFAAAGMGLLPVWLDASPEGLQFLAFLASGSLLFVGAAPMFRLPLQGAVHYTSAVVCCVCSMLWVVFMGYYPIFICCAFLGFMGYVRFGQYMWWLEMAVIGMVFASLL